MRIIGGKFKKRRLHPPRGMDARPTTDRAKEGLFNTLESRMALEGKEVLDLYAGTGNIALEFASRNVRRVDAVEQDPKLIRFIGETAEQWRIPNLKAFKSDAEEFLKGPHGPYDIIFADPPYPEGEETRERLVNTVRERECLKPGGILIIEQEKGNGGDVPSGAFQTRDYGKVRFGFWTSAPSGHPE